MSKTVPPVANIRPYTHEEMASFSMSSSTGKTRSASEKSGAYTQITSRQEGTEYLVPSNKSHLPFGASEKFGSETFTAIEMQPQFEAISKLDTNMVDRLFRENTGSSIPSIGNPSSLFPNLSLSLDGHTSEVGGLPNAPASILSYPYCNIEELITRSKQFQNLNQNLSLGPFDAITHAALMADLNQKISEVEQNLLLPTRNHSGQGSLNVKTSIHDSELTQQYFRDGRTLSTLRLMLSKRQSSSSCEEPASKRSRTEEAFNNVSREVKVVVPLSASERKATFPLPPLKGPIRRPLKMVKANSTFKQLWEKFEKISDAMDDTASDQEAFVKKLFIRSLHRSGLSHLTERIQQSTSEVEE